MSKHIIFDCDGTLVDTSLYKYTLYDGIKDLLTALSKGATLYVWTARDRRSTLRILKELDILQFFDGICTIDDAPPKPHIGGLVELVGETGKQSICVIGDSSNDIIGAKNFGVKSIGAIWNKSTNGEIMKHIGADFISSDPHSCLEWINNNL